MGEDGQGVLRTKPVTLAVCKANRLSNLMRYLTEEEEEVEELVDECVVVGSEFGPSKWSRCSR